MPDQDEPRRKRRPEGEEDHGRERPTQDRPQMPNFDIPQQGDDHLPAAPNPERPHRGDDTPGGANAPDLDNANPNDTRRAAAQAGQSMPDHMRDMLNRLNRIDRPGDISDEEARRLAGLDTEHDPEMQPVPANTRPRVEPQFLPALVSRDLAHLSRELDAGGMVVPKWHSIRHLPGFQNRQIRGMGQDVFSMFTRTPHHNIKTIASMNGRGPNTDREVNAVANWLHHNAEELPEAHIDYSQAGMINPMTGEAYSPRVKEYRTNNTRFHVVQDDMGHYIYAYPEQDAVEPGAAPAQLGHDAEDNSDHTVIGDTDFDSMLGASKPKKLKEGTQMKFNSISEEIRYFAENLERLQHQSLVESWNNELLEALLDESTLSKMIGKNPGGQSLVRYLHRQHKLGNMAEYEEVPLSVKNVAVSIKRNRDNFAICVGTTGVAAVKPLEDDWNRSANPERDGTMRYVVVWATQDAPAQHEVRKFRFGRTDATGGTSGMESGAPNIFQVLRDRIGPMQAFYRAPEAVERQKIGQRDELKKPTFGRKGNKIGMPSQTGPIDPDTGEPTWVMPGSAGEPASEQDIVKKISGRFQAPYQQKDASGKPTGKSTTIYANMLQQAMGDMQDRISRLVKAGNMDQAQKLIANAAEIQNINIALDTATPNWDQGPLRRLQNVIKHSVAKMAQGGDEKHGIMAALGRGEAEQMMKLLTYARDQLYTIRDVSQY